MRSNHLSLSFSICSLVMLACVELRSQDGQQIESSSTSYSKNNSYSDTYGGYLPSVQPDYVASRPYDQNVGSHPYVPNYESSGNYRQPTSIVFVDEQTALVTTKLTGQVFELHWPADASRSDHELRIVHDDKDLSWGEVIKLSSDLVAIAEENQSQVVLFGRENNNWKILYRLQAPGSPNALAWDEQAATLLATGKWSQRLYRWQHASALDSSASKPVAGIAPSNAHRWSNREHVDLAMCGGRILVLPKHQSILIVDAFGRDYAVVDRSDLSIRHTEKLYGHNVTDLYAIEDESLVLFPHQMLNEYARSVQTDITWGGMMSNNLRWLRTERLLHEHGIEIFKKGKFYPLGSPGNGAGDPSSLAVSSQGMLAITLAGTNRVAVGNESEYYFRQMDVGIRPVDCAFSPDESTLVVVNQFSDSLSLVNLADDEVQHVSLGALREPTQVERGEQLFFSSRLSHDGWMSCHSCHSQGHTNGQLNDNFSDKSFETPKRVLSLLGQAETTPYSWSGAMPTLAAQVRSSIQSTMAGNAASDEAVEAIAAYVQQLPQPPSLMAARMESGGVLSESESVQVAAGQALFQKLNCADCHSGAWFTSPETYDVSMQDENEMHHFNPPSLRSASQRQNSLFHDGRSQSLRDAFMREKHQVPSDVSASDISDLVRFLESL